jgi:diguanylate cyclase (GGDEF)-like protein
MSDIILETFRALTTGVILIYLLLIGKKETIRHQKGWTYILAGFALIFFGMVVDISDNFPSMNKYLIVGDTAYEAFLEKVIGYLLGFLLLAIGFVKWMPTVMALRQAERALRKSSDELELKVTQRTSHLQDINEELQHEITKRKELEKEFKKLATTDNLTQAYNKMKFREIMPREMERAERFNEALSILMIDIDSFKKINDTYGHVEGDYVLKTIADLVREKLRKVNYFVRWGGDEFVVIAVETDLEGSRILAERVRKSIENYKFDKVGKVTASFGIAQLKKGETEDSLITRADKALYKAKENGRNRVKENVGRIHFYPTSKASEG